MLAAPTIDPAKDGCRVHDTDVPAGAAKDDLTADHLPIQQAPTSICRIPNLLKSRYDRNGLSFLTSKWCEPVCATRSLCVTPESKKARQVPRTRRSCRASNGVRTVPSGRTSRRFAEEIAVQSLSRMSVEQSILDEPLAAFLARVRAMSSGTYRNPYIQASPPKPSSRPCVICGTAIAIPRGSTPRFCSEPCIRVALDNATATGDRRERDNLRTALRRATSRGDARSAS